MTCENGACKKRAIFKVWREGKIAAKMFCAVCFGMKASKYALRAERI